METLGQKLRSARERKRMNLSRAAALTRIKIQHLEMIENDDFSKMPAPTYAKGFLRIYAGLLGLDPAPLVQEYVDRHLNATEDDRRAVSAKAVTISDEPDSAAETSSSAPPVSFSDRIQRFVSWLQKVARQLVPYAPRLAVLLVAVFLVVGVVKCGARFRSSVAESPDEAMRLDAHAIMKEPPVRYLELPPSEDVQP